MGQVCDIPYSALISALLLKSREVSFNEIHSLVNKVYSFGCNYCVCDDDYVDSNLTDIYNLLYLRDKSFVLNGNYDYDSLIGNLTVREILEMTSTSFGSDILLNLVGYQKVEVSRSNKASNVRNNRVLSKIKSIKNNTCNKNNSRVGIGVKI